jgi:hypothetical protein
VHAEEWTSRGISDLVLEYRGDVYVIELKKDTPQACLRQIREKGYGAKYASAPYLALVGISIDAPNRTLREYRLEARVT